MNEETHFQKLIQLPSEDHEAYLAKLNDSDLVARLRDLLSAHLQRESLLWSTANESTSIANTPTDSGTIGPYKLREQIPEASTKSG